MLRYVLYKIGFFSAMERWKKITCIVALYMFVTHTRPLEPFMTAYFISESDGDVTLSEVPN